MHIITAYYYACADYLKEYLPCIPKLKLTNAKTYYGRIYIKNGEFESIALSKWNLDCGRSEWWDKEDIDILIETICHEFAHMSIWEHGKDHDELTRLFIILAKSRIELQALNEHQKLEMCC
ncbi:MAG: hypothetical protein N4A54_04125 [Peptostreptococcaceae bacterium]|jgi:hypothetical protein|nr:hypothetical protein [Peptostreptococcaceae bacterium]